MTGTWLRGPTMPEPSPHTCGPPRDSSIGRGAIWRCPCGRRWIAVDRTRTMPAGNGTLGRPARPVWKRRRLPWPRRTAEERRLADEQRQEQAIDRALAAGQPLPKGTMIKAPGPHTPIVFDMSPTPNAGEPPIEDYDG